MPVTTARRARSRLATGRLACALLALCPAGLSRAGIEEAEPHNEAGIAHLQAGRALEAAAAFERALARAPESRVVRRNLAAALAARAEDARRDGDADEAVRLLDRALDLHPGRLRYRVLRGRARFETGRDADRLFAAEDFGWVLERDPDHLDALVNLGHVAYAGRRLKEAVRLWTHALALRPGDADIAQRLAKARRELAAEAGYEQVTTDRFLLRYAPTIPRARAGEILQLCEQAYGELAPRFDARPEATIAVTLYTPEEFRSATRMLGWVAGLSDGTIRLTVRPGAAAGDLRATIYHELTHHLIRMVARRVPVWLHEGLAQLSEGKDPSRACARLAAGPQPRPAELSARILRQSDARRVARFYDLSLAFARHLRDLQGDAGIKRLLSEFERGRPEEEALLAIYGSGRDALFARWRETLHERRAAGR